MKLVLFDDHQNLQENRQKITENDCFSQFRHPINRSRFLGRESQRIDEIDSNYQDGETSQEVVVSLVIVFLPFLRRDDQQRGKEQNQEQIGTDPRGTLIKNIYQAVNGPYFILVKIGCFVTNFSVSLFGNRMKQKETKTKTKEAIPL
jgi:hypothetical protein